MSPLSPSAPLIDVISDPEQPAWNEALAVAEVCVRLTAPSRAILMRLALLYLASQPVPAEGHQGRVLDFQAAHCAKPLTS